MLVGVPKEIKNHEYRCGMTPAGVRELVGRGHQVLVQRGLGAAIGIADDDYQDAGAEVVADAETVFDRAELLVKVKEPQERECTLLRPDQTLFTYLHLAPDRALTQRLLDTGATCIAYETVTDDHGGLPLLAPMSEVAGRVAVQAGAHCLEIAQGGSGVLLGGVPGVEAANVLVLGGGVVGLSAARMAAGLGARVVILDKSLPRLRQIDDLYGARLQTLYSTGETLERQLAAADLVVGAVLVPGAAAPKLVTRSMLGGMKAGSVLVDVAIDQGGCFETSRPTTHQDPTYSVDGVVHYCVANIPGGVARTATQALTNATLPYIIALADQGPTAAMRADRHLLQGLNVHAGRVTNRAVAAAQECEFVAPGEALQQV